MIVKEILPKAFVFDDRTLLKCFYCVKYGHNNHCPPNIPKLDYRKMIRDCDNALLFCYKQNFKKSITPKDRIDSSGILHEAVLRTERILWENNYPLAISFIGGSCKICGRECSDVCSVKGRIPLEAIGVDITKTARKIGVEIVYPPIDYFYRVGTVLW